ncbi:outer membrane protein assembly factor BamE domain-containing protein [Roseibium sediminis]|uniref:outer membrane protein assembly factor BamE domain-containing protein n=1 Tax=Roseibium sediminis TaxID=1775174 RepID=UPI00123E3535|nr:outer membrane protein assembly factor BamE [Roseibium sediminis]
MKNIILAIAIAAAVGACASKGNESLREETETSVAGKLTEGKTTRSQVQQMFGSPFETSFTDSGDEIWTYQFDKLQADAVNFVPIVNSFGSSYSGKRKQLVVLFDRNNVVKRYSMTDSDVSVKSGLF